MIIGSFPPEVQEWIKERTEFDKKLGRTQREIPFKITKIDIENCVVTYTITDDDFPLEFFDIKYDGVSQELKDRIKYFKENHDHYKDK